MKTSLILIFFSISIINCYSQEQFKLFVGLENGPKWTLTENLIRRDIRTIETEIGYSYGLVFGTMFPKENFIVETGVTRLSYDFKYNMENGPYPYYPDNPNRPKDFIEPTLVVSTWSIQIPLRVKSRVYHSLNNKFSLWLTGCANFTEMAYPSNNYKLRTNFIVNDTTGRLILTRQIDDQTISKPIELNILLGNARNILIELGLETHYKITNKFQLTLAGRYQGGFKTVFISNVEDTVRDPRSGTFIKRVYTASNGDGVFLNLGLLYTFGKQQNSKE